MICELGYLGVKLPVELRRVLGKLRLKEVLIRGRKGRKYGSAVKAGATAGDGWQTQVYGGQERSRVRARERER